MSISSMTAFACYHASSTVSSSSDNCTWEIQSVNARGLDVRVRLPRGLERLELSAREMVGRYCKRGTISLTLTLKKNSDHNRLHIDEELLTRLIAITSEWHQRYPEVVHVPRLDGLLVFPGVLVPCRENGCSLQEVQERELFILLSLERALDLLVTIRIEEGQKLALIMNSNLDVIDSLIERASECANIQPKIILHRLRELIEILLEKVPNLSEERLVEEAAISATRADVREELDRLRAHVLAVRQLLAEGGFVGRRIDFLCQELTREANTLCMKAKSLDLTYIGIDLKTIIAQLREQIQNIE